MYFSPRELRLWRLRRLTFALLVLAVFLAFTSLDHWIWSIMLLPQRAVDVMIDGDRVHATQSATEWLRAKDWYQVLRQAGYLPTWFLIAAAMLLHDLTQRLRTPIAQRPLLPTPEQPLEWWRRGTLIALAPTLAGLIAEALRVVLRRSRPGEDGLHHWGWPWSDYHGSFGLPSSHAAVAFAGALMLARFLPGTGPILLLWACGCALSRLLPGAHFASDTFLGAVVSFAAVRLLLRTIRPGPFRADLPGPWLSLS
jgi:membrane-associated phospholipid phosphatase